MKKENFVTLVLGTVSVVLFAIGMCMALIPGWNPFQPGITFGAVGIILGVITWIIRRRMEGKAQIHISGHTVLAGAVGIIGALALGVGMCFRMV